ncbi:hypothetical protein C0J52_05692 [Blattella germanica]|nr:hypothetical protein C0J52_05692 [Blattella germanica]
MRRRRSSVKGVFPRLYENGKVIEKGVKYYMKLFINLMAAAAQITGFVVWPLLENSNKLWMLPVATVCISCGWWENFYVTRHHSTMDKFLKRLQNTRYYSFMFLSLWKMLCMFVTMIVVFNIEYGDVYRLFDLFGTTYSQRDIIVQEVVSYNSSGLPNIEDGVDRNLNRNIARKFACKILIQSIGYALPVNLTVPISISLLITMCGLRNGDPCYFSNIIPDYLFFISPPYYEMEQYLTVEHAWIWLLWLFSQTWITVHIWMPRVDRLMPTEVLFTLPMYESLLVDQSLALNRRHDDGYEIDASELEIVGHEAEHAMEHKIQEEMAGIDGDPIRTNIFFDDAFEIRDANFEGEEVLDVVVNRFVRDLITTIDEAASEVHGTEYKMKPPKKYPTPYGGRLVWTLPGKTRLIVHLKDKDKIRHKKRWSQVMYMYYLLGHRLMELPITLARKEVIARNTFILALDGDIDFKPEAVHLLLDLMKKDSKLGAACGRIHPVGQGEDRWLCTLLLQRGYRVEYSAASDAYTHCPESFDEFYNQRRRWVPSTMANIMDLLMDYKRTIRINDNISLLYILYQLLLMGGSILGPGNIFLMLVGAFNAAFKIDNWTSFIYNIIPILLYMGICFLCKSNVQLIAAKVISAIYGLVMMAVLVGIMLQIDEDGPFAPSSLFFFIVAGEMIIAAFLHPQEFNCLPAGIVYYVTVPSMYLLLIVYSIFNLNVVSWGTREVAVKMTKSEMERKKKEEEEAKKMAKKKNFLSFFRKDKESEQEEGSFELNLAGLFKCMCCTYPKASEEKMQLMRIADSLEKVGWRLDNIERSVDPLSQGQHRRRSTINLNKRDLDPLAEDGEEESDEESDNETEETKEERDEVNPYWIDHHEELRKGVVDFLPTKEKQFWKDLIDSYLYVIIKNKEAKKSVLILSSIYSSVYFQTEKLNEQKLKDLRDMSVFAFFMLNALFVLVIFLLQLSKDQLHINWPFGVKANITYNPDNYDITISKEYLELEPIGMLFIVFFGIILIIQFIAMLFHRFGTLMHMLSTTQLQGSKSDDKDAEARSLVKDVMNLQKLRGADGDLDAKDPLQENLGRPSYPSAVRRLTVVRRDTLQQARKSIMEERRRSQIRRASRSMPGSSRRDADNISDDVDV